MSEGRRRFLSWSLLRNLAIGFGAVVLVAVVTLVGWINWVGRDLPDHNELARYEPPVTSRVHAGDGTLIAEFARENRVFIPYDAVPDFVIEAFVSAEDKKFFEHSGIDYFGMLRGVSRTVMNKLTGKSGMQGGSTISQQVAKNMLLTNEQTVERKVKEAIITMRMEKAFSKEKIMELYLNEIFLGRNSYGIGSAAMNYFNRSLPELDLAQAATLAALAQRPGAVNPDTNPERLVVRRDWVLSRMVANGYITQEEADAAAAQPLTTQRRLRGPEYEAAAFFVEEVRRELVKTYDEDKLLTGGLSIRSTIDTRLQLAAQESLRENLVAYDRRRSYRGPVARLTEGEDAQTALAAVKAPGGTGDWELARVAKVSEKAASVILTDGSAVALEPDDVSWAAKTWKTEAGVSGLAVGDVILVEVERKGGKAEAQEVVDATVEVAEVAAEGEAATAKTGKPVGLARLRQIPQVEGALIAMDPHTGRVLAMAGGFSFWKSQYNRVTQAKRQPGSTFKAFVYAAALENGYTPSTRVLDAPFVDFDVSTDRFWKPTNYEEGQFYGLSTLRLGLEKSRNAMTVRMAQDVGMSAITALVHRLGVYSEPPPPFLSISLGAAETTPLAMAEGYAVFVNGGKRVRATFVDRVQDRYGHTLYRYDGRACEGCSLEQWDGQAPPELADAREAVLDPVTAFQVTHMLQGVVERGTARRALRIGKPVAGKTGTSNDAFDTWFVGFSPDLVVGVWVGFDEPKSLGSNETGGSVALPVFTDFMVEALKDEASLPFRMPPGVRLVRIDARTGDLPTAGSQDIILEAYRPGTEPGVDFGDDSRGSLFGDNDGRVPPAERPGETALPAEEVVGRGLDDGTW